MTDRPIALLTNDDGIDSWFMAVVADALQPHFEVRVVAPARPQSWVGRSITCRRPVEVWAHEGLGVRAWAVEGTPADCVNLALGHLLDAPPAVVVSGINMGYNVTLPLLLSSGTVAAAVEGALWGMPALALSMALPPDEFSEIHAGRGAVKSPLRESVLAAAAHGARHAVEVAATVATAPIVHSFNFPIVTTADTPVQRTRPARQRSGSLFEPSDRSGLFNFRYAPPGRHQPDPADDIRWLDAGWISHTVVDLSALGALA